MKALAMTVSCYSEENQTFTCQSTLTDCGIHNCVLCDQMDMKCTQCEEGYHEDNGECLSKYSTQLAICLLMY